MNKETKILIAYVCCISLLLVFIGYKYGEISCVDVGNSQELFCEDLCQLKYDVSMRGYSIDTFADKGLCVCENLKTLEIGRVTPEKRELYNMAVME